MAWQRRFVQFNDRNVHVRDSGSGPAILLLHQTPLSGSMFDELRSELSEYCLIAVDTPGYGLSDPLDPEPEMTDFASCMLAVLDALGVDRCHILGIHTGASMAVEIAASHPERVNKLILIGVPDYEPDMRVQKLKEAIPPVVDADFPLATWQGVTGGMWQGWASLEQVQRAFLDQLIAGVGRSVATRAVFRHDVRTRIPAITAPALLVYGDGDPFVDRQHLVAPLFNDATLTRLPGIGGIPFQEDPAGFGVLARAFLG